MTLLALTITRQTGLRMVEIGELLGLLGGIALLVGAMAPSGKRMGQVLGGLSLALGFALLLIATRWGRVF